VPHLMKRRLTGDGALLDLRSHWDTNFIGGRPFAPDFPTPVQFAIDTDSEGRRMPTLFTTPALLAVKPFADLLAAAGVDNVDVYPATILNPETGETIDDYVVLNIVGAIACADLEASSGVELAPGIRVLDEPVLRQSVVREARIFRLAEDPVQIVVADALADRIRAAGFDDVYLEPLAAM